MINENYDKIDGKYVKNESSYYHCRWPKDPDEIKKRKLISEAKLNNKVNKYKQSYFPY